MNVKLQLKEDMKAAMRAREQDRLGTVRLIIAAIKQREIDEQCELEPQAVTVVLEKMAKQRRDAIVQFEQANRTDLVAQERVELDIILSYLPKQLTGDEIARCVKAVIDENAATSRKDMGRVMALLKSQLQGKADMAEVSRIVKSLLA